MKITETELVSGTNVNVDTTQRYSLIVMTYDYY